MNWHYAEGGQQVGPVTEEEFQRLVQAGRIDDETLVWRPGMADWVPYRQVKSQGDQPVSAPPTISAGGGATLTARAGSSEPEVVCAECGRLFRKSETIQFGKASVCAACKPVFLQKLSEGAQITAPGEMRYAGFWIRFAAIFVDGLVLGAIGFFINFVGGLVLSVSTKGEEPNPGALVFVFLLMGVNLLIRAAYETILVGKYGATLGKMACKLQVVTAEGEKVTYGRACGRFFGKLLSSFTCLIGFIIAGFDDEKRALHDHICHTRVIYK